MPGEHLGRRILHGGRRALANQRSGSPAMTEPTARFWEVFFEVYERLPRQGPGSHASAARALDLCSELPSSPTVLDLGCGVRGPDAAPRRSHRSKTPSWPSTATHRTSSACEQQLPSGASLTGFSLMVGDIGRPHLASESFDLIWSEGALYNVGIENALHASIMGSCTPAVTSRSRKLSGARRIRHPR